MNSPGQVVGTISFTHISGSPEFSCRLGYRLSKEVQGYGYATEALSYLIPIFCGESKGYIGVIRAVPDPVKIECFIDEPHLFVYCNISKNEKKSCYRNEVISSPKTFSLLFISFGLSRTSSWNN